MARKFFVGGNFKANGSIKSIQGILDNLNNAKLDPNTGMLPLPAPVVISPPSIFLLTTAEKASNGIKVAAQNVFDKPDGAWTGELTVKMLTEHNIEWVILGHSERRTIIKESSEFVADKTKAALDGGLSVILCIGETLEEREAGKTVDVCCSQLQAVVDKVSDWSKIVIAYEPVWAIGTGKVATTEQAQEAHEAIRKWLASKLSQGVADGTRILYGGSVNEKNSGELAKQPDIDGFLVGGASLKPAFVDIINANL
ncbi:triosephosphate isomerase [Drechslerella stenobrocha 248]|uniref:Triosephosphate isomerase n=1 Tax=Drechslerella stenobrocha 248 TaxID=1043628 RepID=W7HYG6_9PEZI|nr:triosephosphate isomerase [Drechslerella stenobrocha 248]